ncbi:APC family permease [Methylococcus sp. EFPC2]|uniref:APC family permease n=1 Tax=Methylococcus sp. EFPC2 TaxID=2812648 RepID=UPI001966EF6D|nr:amino acid permease [Methylococcus sp. EFPC2]QSA96023.1 amino acid permease [Methylococcus sp. EFPC2]
MRSSSRFELVRAFGFLEAGAIVTGSVVGTGIFLVPSTIARETGSVAGAFLVWLVGGLLSLAGALSYAELGAAMPEAGGEYAYLRRAYGPFWGFLFGWQQLLIAKTGSIASIATGFALFLGFFLPGIQEPALSVPMGTHTWALSGVQFIAIATIVALTALNYLRIGFSGAVQSLLTLIKIAAIVLLAVLALSTGPGRWENLQGGLGLSPVHGGLGYVAALSAALWAYDGWNNLVHVGAEVRDPNRTIPAVLIWGMAGVVAIYMLANLAYFYILPLDQAMRSERLAQDVAVATLGTWGGTAITLIAAISSLATLNGSVLSGPRVSYAMARDGLLFDRMADVHPVHRTPVKALLLQCLAAVGLILILGRDREAYERLFNFTMFGTWLFYGITALSVVVLRRRCPELLRPYRTLGYPWVPLAFVFVAAAFCLGLLLERPADCGLGVAFLAAGLPFYVYCRGRGR